MPMSIKKNAKTSFQELTSCFKLTGVQYLSSKSYLCYMSCTILNLFMKNSYCSHACY